MIDLKRIKKINNLAARLYGVTKQPEPGLITWRFAFCEIIMELKKELSIEFEKGKQDG